MLPPGGVAAREKLLAAQAAAPPRVLKAVAAKTLSLGGGNVLMGLGMGGDAVAGAGMRRIRTQLHPAPLSVGRPTHTRHTWLRAGDGWLEHGGRAATPPALVPFSSSAASHGAGGGGKAPQVQVAASRSAKSFTGPLSPLATLQQLASGGAPAAPSAPQLPGAGDGAALRPTAHGRQGAGAGGAARAPPATQQQQHQGLALVPTGGGSGAARAPVGRTASLHNLAEGAAAAPGGLSSRRGVGALQVATPTAAHAAHRDPLDALGSGSPTTHHLHHHHHSVPVGGTGTGGGSPRAAVAVMAPGGSFVARR